MTMRLSHVVRLALLGSLMLIGLILAASTDRLGDRISGLLRAEGVNDVDGAKRSLVYRLRLDRPTKFTLSGERELVRLLSSVSIAESAPIAPAGWVYGYRVAFLDAAGAVIEERDIYSRAVLPEMTEEIEPHRFLRTSNERIAIQNEAIIDAPEGTAAINLLALDADRGVLGMDIRVYERQPLSDSGALVAFRRRSSEEQAQLTSGSAFPADILSEAEMRAASRNNWRPIGPNGIAGEAYQLVVMYEVDVDENEAEVVAAP
ncbi:hypothetical protein K3152_13030 [Qipengyuania sp. 1NDH17]|uniref:DUF3108 domain-containing protein n=1 Tax=Qipengyuania polymorpha TaxID=2867234 RepID=A0ABS7J488_9SPHN|nr:hypothetical protein [Qipengyuania polymorpha]MBX7459175.1 hypothetical protein [Qipengyuania polymorpha]